MSRADIERVLQMREHRKLLLTMNTTGFAGASDWRLPTIAELQTISVDFDCSGVGLGPGCRCPVTRVSNQLGFSLSDGYWSGVEAVAFPGQAWGVGFDYGGAESGAKLDDHYVRAVRGGL